MIRQVYVLHWRPQRLLMTSKANGQRAHSTGCAKDNAFTVKLPPSWALLPEVWFAQAEDLFCSYSGTSLLT